MFKLRKELVGLIKWEKAAFPCFTQIEIDATGHRVLRKAELFRRIHEIAERN